MKAKSVNIPTTYSEALKFLKETVEEYGLGQDVIDQVASYPLKQEKVDAKQAKEMISLFRKIINTANLNKDDAIHEEIDIHRLRIQSLEQELTGAKEDWDDTMYSLADEMKFRTNKGDFEKHRDAYRWAAKHYTVRGQNITWQQLEKAWHKANRRGYELLVRTPSSHY